MIRIQRRRTKGWRMPEGAVYVGRPSIYCNPFWLDGFTGCGCMYTRSSVMVIEAPTKWTRADLLTCYRAWVQDREIPWPHGLMPGALKNGRYQLPTPPAPLEIASLRRRDLACWCPLDVPCHADVLLELANQEFFA